MDRQKVLSQMEKQFTDIAEKMQEIAANIPKDPKAYTDKSGKTYQECPGAYNDYMSRAMASDMFWFYPIFHTKYQELGDRIGGWYGNMNSLNFRLMRMFDDEKGNRPLMNWSEKKTWKLVKKIKNAVGMAAAIHDKEKDPMLKDFMDRCVIWATRLVYMDDHAFCLHNMDCIDSTQFNSQIEVYDNDGQKISGLKKSEQDLIRTLCQMRAHLTRLLVKIPAGTEDHKYVMDKLELFEKMCDAIMQE